MDIFGLLVIIESDFFGAISQFEKWARQNIMKVLIIYLYIIKALTINA